MAIITYTYPVQGLVPPTQAEAFPRNKTIAEVELEDAYDAAFTITHNLQLTTQELEQGYPRVTLEFNDTTVYTQTPYIIAKTANTVEIGTDAPVGGELLTVTIDRPASWTK